MIAGQAFHWFRPREARVEFARILKPGGWAVLVWHDRDSQSTPFLHAYEAFVRQHSTDYDRVTHKLVNYATLQHFFGPRGCSRSSSTIASGSISTGCAGGYCPRPTFPSPANAYDAMIAALPQLFSTHAVEGHVVLEYETKIYYGHLD